MAFSDNIIRNRTAGEANFPLTFAISNILLKLESKFSLFLLTNKVGKQLFNDCFSLCMRATKAKCRSMVVFFIFLSNCPTTDIIREKISKCFDWSWVGHSYMKFQFVCNSFSSFILRAKFSSDNTNATFTIKKTSKILNRGFHVLPPICMEYNIIPLQSQVELLKKQANSGKLQNGQSRAKQIVNRLLGVCNEHILASKEMMCSELYRNIESATEMLAPFNNERIYDR